VWVAYDGIRQANAALRSQSDEQARMVARSVESLIARNALALRIAANGRIDAPGPCERVQRSLSIAPAVAQRFRLSDEDGRELCGVGDLGDVGLLSQVAPGDIGLRVAPDGDSLILQVGVVGGMATTVIPSEEIRAAAIEQGEGIRALKVSDGRRETDIMATESAVASGQKASVTNWPIANGRLQVAVEGQVPAITVFDQLIILLPVVMWVIAALMTWFLVTRLLIHPLRRLQRAVSDYEPGESALELPSRLGPATEIQELRDAFARAG
jgi:two-component system, sensor histidine kinase PdtaS